jgi:hypothetical protein
MNFGVRKEEAFFLYNLIKFERDMIGDEKIKKIYGDIDIEGMLRQLEIIIMIGESVEEDKRIDEILRK